MILLAAISAEWLLLFWLLCFLWALILISAINNGGGVVEENDRLENMEKNIQKLVAQVSVIESMLSNGILKTQERQDRRLDKHSDRLDALERTQHQALTLKSLFVWMSATILSAVGVAIAIVEVILK